MNKNVNNMNMVMMSVLDTLMHHHFVFIINGGGTYWLKYKIKILILDVPIRKKSDWFFFVAHVVKLANTHLN